MITKPKRKLTETEDQRLRRMAVWRHNAFFGHAAMMGRNAINIAEASTSSPEAKALAIRIQELSSDLAEALKTRIDSPIPAS